MRAMTMIPAMAVVLAASPLHAQSTSPQSATLDSIAPQIEAGFTTFMAENHVPGLVYGVVQGGHLALVKGKACRISPRAAPSRPTACSASPR
jgi:CubicO group peptidase (beta-lactamase class C family)